jgi:hypothetical protein
MKRILILFLVGMFAFQTTGVQAQPDSEVVDFTVIFETVFDLAIVSGNAITVTFTTSADYNNGIVSGTPTDFTVESTINWDVMISGAGDLAPVTGSGAVPLDYVGCWVASTGTFTDGAEFDIAFPDQASAHGLTTTPTAFITNNGGNAGSVTDNAFTITWAVGTQDGSMAAESVFTGLALNKFTAPGQYNTDITLTAQAAP